MGTSSIEKTIESAMIWWFVLLIVLGVTLGVIDIFYYKLGFLHNKMEYDYWIGVAFMLLPLLFFVPQGWRLFQKTPEILGDDRAFAKIKKSGEEARQIRWRKSNFMAVGINKALML